MPVLREPAKEISTDLIYSRAVLLVQVYLCQIEEDELWLESFAHLRKNVEGLLKVELSFGQVRFPPSKAACRPQEVAKQAIGSGSKFSHC